MIEFDGLSEDLQDKVQPIYIVEDFLDNHPIYYDENKIWWIWDSVMECWRMKDDVAVLGMIYRGLDMPGIVKNGVKGQYINAFQIAAREMMPESIPKNWIQFKDCVIDLSRNCQTIKADHTFFFTNPIPWNYVNARDECPTIDKLFVDWVGEEQKKMLYEICAYCMLSDYPIHRIFCMVGGGRNGKGTFMRLLKKFIGEENVTSTSLDRLTNSRFEAAKLYKKMVAFVGETDFAVMKNTAMLKSLVGQDLIPAEFKNKPPFDFQNTAKIIISTNSLPMTGDKTIGFYSRWIIIDFNGFYETEKDVLSGIPDEEYAALAKKCIKILPEIIHAGRFTGEGNFVQKMEKYEQKSNPMKKFMAEKMVAGGPDDKIAFWEFKNLFLAYLNENKFRRLNENEIKGQLAENNIELVRADFYDNGDRRQWLSLIGYRWRDKEESSQKNGIYGSNGIEVPLNSLYKRIKWNVDTTATINTICYRCGSLGPELYPIKDEITRETIWECLSCQKEKLSL